MFTKDRFTAWSYSRLTDYEGCRLRAKLKHLNKLPEPKGPALARGIEAHETLERWGKSSQKSIPAIVHADLAPRFREIARVRKHALIEASWTFDRDWNPCAWDDWDLAWLRVKVDLAYSEEDGALHVTDYKTGKIKPANEDQLSLYAVAAFSQHSNLIAVNTELIYLDAGVTAAKRYEMNEAAELRRYWIKRSRPLLADRTFKATPGVACRWCAYSKERGGPCRF